MNPKHKLEVTLYTKENCPLCDRAKDVVLAVQREISFALLEVDIQSKPDLWSAYRDLIPVLTLRGEEIAYGKVSAHRLRAVLKAAGSRTRPKSALTPRYRAFLKRLKERLRSRRLEP